MLNNKFVLVLGNNTRDTDLQARLYAEQAGLEYRGLITDLNTKINFGVYQTNFADFGDVSLMMKCISKFNELVDLNQPSDSYDNDRSYTLTRHSISLAANRKIVSIIEVNNA